MKKILFFSLFLFPSLILCQDFNYPKIAKNGKVINDFIPSKWHLIKKAKGDLNNDKNDDLAFVIEYEDSVYVYKTEYGDTEIVKAQPRMLIIVFYNFKTKDYLFKEQCNKIIPIHNNENMEEPFQEIAIVKGVLNLNYSVFMNIGSWGTSNSIYKFRLNNNDFELIGAEYNYYNRASGETENKSYNFFTNKMRGSKNNKKAKFKLLKTSKIKTFKTFIFPYNWEIEKDFYL